MKLIKSIIGEHGRSLLGLNGVRKFSAAAAGGIPAEQYDRRNFSSLTSQRKWFLSRDAYNDMLRDGVQPSRESFHSLIIGTMKRGARLQDAFYFRDQMKAMGLVPDETKFGSPLESSACHCHSYAASTSMLCRSHGVWVSKLGAFGPAFTTRSMTTDAHNKEPVSASTNDIDPPRIKFKRLDKTARHIMQIIDKEQVQAVKEHRDFPDIQPGDTVQLKVEVPENKRRVSTLKGTVIAKRNAGLHSTFRIRRMVAGVGVESVFPLYSPNIKEMKVLNKNKHRRAKLYYLRDRKNALKKQ